jgi:hypothetical protein
MGQVFCSPSQDSLDTAYSTTTRRRTGSAPQERHITTNDFDIIWRQWQSKPRMERKVSIVEALNASASIVIWFGAWAESLQKSLQEQNHDDIVKKLARMCEYRPGNMTYMEHFKLDLKAAYLKWLQITQWLETVDEPSNYVFVARPKGDFDLNDWTPELLAADIIRHVNLCNHGMWCYERRPISTNDFEKISRQFKSKFCDVKKLPGVSAAFNSLAQFHSNQSYWAKKVEKHLVERDHDGLVKVLALPYFDLKVGKTDLEVFRQDLAATYPVWHQFAHELDALSEKHGQHGIMVMRPKGNLDLNDSTPELLAQDIVRHYHNCEYALKYRLTMRFI